MKQLLAFVVAFVCLSAVAALRIIDDQGQIVVELFGNGVINVPEDDSPVLLDLDNESVELLGGTSYAFEVYDATPPPEPNEPPPPDPNEPPPPDPNEPLPPPSGQWTDVILEHLPNPGTFAVIPELALQPVLLPDDGTQLCDYLRCSRSFNGVIDWTGAALDVTTGEYIFPMGGGHGDYGANTVYRCSIVDLTCYREFDFSPLAPNPNTGDVFPTKVDSNGDGKWDCYPPQYGTFASHTYAGVARRIGHGETWVFRSSGYGPKWNKCAGFTWGADGGQVQVWSDAGQWLHTGVPQLDFPKAVYHPERDVFYVASQKGCDGTDGVFEFDPTTHQCTKRMGYWNGKGGAIALSEADENGVRTLWITSRGTGVTRRDVAPDGTFSNGAYVLNWGSDSGIGRWQGGIAGFRHKAIVWTGGQEVTIVDDTGVVHDQLAAPYGEGVGENILAWREDSAEVRVYGKFWAVPESMLGVPGVAIGFSGNWGLVIYRAP